MCIYIYMIYSINRFRVRLVQNRNLLNLKASSIIMNYQNLESAGFAEVSNPVFILCSYVVMFIQCSRCIFLSQLHAGMLGASKYLAPNLEVTFGKQTSRLTYPFQLRFKPNSYHRVTGKYLSAVFPRNIKIQSQELWQMVCFSEQRKCCMHSCLHALSTRRIIRRSKNTVLMYNIFSILH